MLLENKRKFTQYVIACFLPIIGDLARMGIIAMVFEAADRKSMDFFKLTILASIIFVFFEAGMFIFSRMLRIAFMRDTLLSLRIRAFDKIMNLSYQGFHQKSRDSYLSNLMNDINTFEQSFFLALINFIFRCGLYVTVMAILFVVEWRIALIAFGTSFLVLLIAKLFEKRTVTLQKQVSDENENATLNYANTFSGLEILKLNNIEREFLKNSEKRIEKLESKKFGYRFITALQINTNGAIGYIVLMGVMLYMTWMISRGSSYGMIALTIQLSSMAIFPLVNMMPLINTLKSSQAIYDKITAQVTESNEGDHKRKFLFKNKIEVIDLNFQYEDTKILHDASFTLEKGKKYLLKGPSGAGKSTIMKLLSGTYDNYTGTIKIDGTELRTIDTKSFYDKATFIYQDVFLFEASLKDNIALFKQIDQQKLDQAISVSGLSDFVKSHPEGTDLFIEENGKNLSGGERQRVAIARAMYKDADILFIDEATSSLNDEIARTIEQTILSLGQTVLSISHKFYPGLTDKYDYVIEVKSGFVTTYSIKEYFPEAQNEA